MFDNDWFDSHCMRTDWLTKLEEIHQRILKRGLPLPREEASKLLSEAKELARKVSGEYPSPEEKEEANFLVKAIEDLLSDA